jgi:uncharacterized membrane protein YkvA (DUF1232 family)
MSSSPPRKLTEQELQALRALVSERAKHMSEEDLRALLGQEPALEKKTALLGKRLPGMVRQVKVGFAMVRDYAKGDYRKIPWWSVASVAAALGYFLMPADLLPDVLPLVGYLDDATVLAAVLAGVREDVRRYCEAKGLELPE